MGKHFTLARLVPQQKIQRMPAPSHVAHTFRAVAAGSAVTLGIIVALCTYVYQVNAVSTSGYVAAHVQSQIASAQAQYQQLEVQAAQSQSLQQTEADPAVATMVPVDTITYIQTGAVALR